MGKLLTVFNDHLDNFEKKDGDGLREETKKQYRNYVKRVIDQLKAKIEENGVDGLIEELNYNIENRGNRQMKAAYTHFLKSIGREELRERLGEPAKQTNDKITKDQIIWSESLRKLFRNTDDPFWLFTFSLLFDTGIRNSTARRIQFKHITPVNKKNFSEQDYKRHRDAQVKATISVERKGGKKDKVYITDDTYDVLRRLIKTGRYKKHDNLRDAHLIKFYKYYGDAYANQQDQFTKQFKQKVDDIIGETHTPHNMRHTAITYLVQQGVPLNKVQEYAGHDDLQTTLKYVEVADKFKLDAMRDHTTLDDIDI